MPESETLGTRRRERRRKRDGGTGGGPGIKTSGGSMKSPNLALRLKLDHNASANCGKKQLAGEEQRLSIVREAPVAYCLDTESILG